LVLDQELGCSLIFSRLNQRSQNGAKQDREKNDEDWTFMTKSNGDQISPRERIRVVPVG
jgi:hypothetical protein